MENFEDIYDLSPMQQGMLFHTLYAPKSGIYFEQTVITLDGELNKSAFKQAWQQVIDRHPILRTEFYWEELDKPLQVVRKEVNLPWNEQNWCEVVDPEQELQHFLAADREQGFELDQAPLIRCALMQIAAQRYYFVWSFHHLLLDGWSTSLLQQEIWAAYHRLTELHPHGAPWGVDACRGELLFRASPRLYKDYIAWLQQQDLAEAEGYWRQALQGFTAPTPLVVDYDHRAALNDHDQALYSEHKVHLSKETSAALQMLARENRLTINTVIQGTWALLLSRYSREEEVLFGATVSGRPAELRGVEKMVGLFINTLPVRVLIKSDMPILPWLSDLQEQHREREQYAYSPLIDIQGWSEVPRGTPLFESLLVYENYPKESDDEGILQITDIRSVEEANYPLSLIAANVEKEDGAQLYLRLSYDTSRFEQGTISRMMGHLSTLLSGIVANPDQAIADLPLLTESEKHQLLVEWNDSQTDYPSDQSIHQLFEQQVARTPDAVAVLFGDQQLTYHELNTRANQLAHYLVAQGVGPDVLVGISVERSVEMVVGLLGILKAGGAYLPLDPDYPAERLSFMLDDAQVPILLTQQQFVERLSEQGVQRLSLDSDWPTIAAESTQNPPNQLGPENLAYVIYTSGSTGRPKGVMVPHRAINRLVNNTNYIDITAGDRMAQASNASFDAATFEIWGALLHGACLVGIPRDVAISPQRLAAELKQQEISILFLTTALFNQVVNFAPNAFDSLRYLLFGGEAVDPIAVRKLLDYGPPEHFLHVYGPTENTTYSSWYPIQRVAENAVTVPIGVPIANTEIYVLDGQLSPVPIGVPGELYLGGDGLALGYLKRAKLTKERFIPNPFRKDRESPTSLDRYGRVGEWESGRSKIERLYKTGDNVRYLPDGNIEFLGRADYQVKIRGFRIELGEIEAHLRQCVGVREAIVVMREENSHKQLVAYVVGEVPSRAQLHSVLPDYMIPSIFVLLEAMPLTPNGKIDRRALPAAREAYGNSAAEQVLPRTSFETILVAIWQEVLGIEQVGVTDNFFEVGGDSIISIQIVSRAKEADIQLTPKDLFEHQTIAELASAAEARDVQKTDAEAARPSASAASQQGIITGALPLTPIQHWFLEQTWQEPHHFNQSVLLELTSDINPTWLSQAVQALLTHHDALRLRFEREREGEGGSWQQTIVAPEPDVPFEVIDLSGRGPNEQVAILEKANQLQASLNLSQGPLLRVALFQSSTANRLLIIIHHLAVDGVSWRILLEDLERAYQQVASGSEIKLPAKSTSFKQWATLLNEKGPSALQAEQDYWAQLSAYETRLPVDYQLGPNDNASAAHISTRLTRAQTQALLNEVPAVYHTQINDLLLTALLLAVNAWTGQPALLLNLEGHGREELFEVDLSRTVGWFTSIFPLRLELTTSDLGETIKGVKEQLRIIPNRGIGYGILRYLSALDVPEVEAEVSFNYLGQFDQSARGTLILGRASESIGSTYSPTGLRPHLLDINGMVIEGELQVDWTYSRNFHRAETIQELANRFIDALQGLIAHCQEPEAGGYTPSDFPEAKLNQDELDDLLSGIKI